MGGLIDPSKMITPRHVADLRQQIASAPSEFYRCCEEQNVELDRIGEYLREMNRLVSIVKRKIDGVPDPHDEASKAHELAARGKAILSSVLERHFPATESVPQPRESSSLPSSSSPSSHPTQPEDSDRLSSQASAQPHVQVSGGDESPQRTAVVPTQSRSLGTQHDLETVARNSDVVPVVSSDNAPLVSAAPSTSPRAHRPTPLRRRGQIVATETASPPSSSPPPAKQSVPGSTAQHLHASGKGLVKDVVRARAIIGSAQFIREQFRDRLQRDQAKSRQHQQQQQSKLSKDKPSTPPHAGAHN